jgi:5-methylcytosine-specific restriction endonuclease McrA
MPWSKTADDRRRDAATYGDAEYQRNRRIVLAEAGGRCEQCGTTMRRLQVDHIVAVTAGGGHDLDNLRALCSGPGSCHAAKTATEGQGFRQRNAADPEHSPRTVWLRRVRGLSV